MIGRRLLAVFALLALLLVACDRNDTDLSTTSSLLTGTTAPVGTSTTAVPEAGPSTTLRGQTVVEYEVSARETTDNGDVLIVLIPEGAYTDIDLENFLRDLKESIDGLWEVDVVDDASAVALVKKPEDQLTEAEQDVLDQHHFVSLVEGVTIRFRGPFASSGEYSLGS